MPQPAIYRTPLTWLARSESIRMEAIAWLNGRDDFGQSGRNLCQLDGDGTAAQRSCIGGVMSALNAFKHTCLKLVGLRYNTLPTLWSWLSEAVVWCGVV